MLHQLMTRDEFARWWAKSAKPFRQEFFQRLWIKYYSSHVDGLTFEASDIAWLMIYTHSISDKHLAELERIVLESRKNLGI